MFIMFIPVSSFTNIKFIGIEFLILLTLNKVILPAQMGLSGNRRELQLVTCMQ